MPNTITSNTKQDGKIISPDPSPDPFQLYKFGIMVNALDMSQQGYFIVKQLNDIVDANYRFSPIVFYKEYAKSIDVNRFCTLLEKEVWGFTGVVLATDLETADTLIHCPCPTKKFFYVWDLEWLYGMHPYKQLQDIYQSDLELIARNQDHADILTKEWKKPQYIMDNFEPAALTQIVKEHSVVNPSVNQ